MLKCINLSLSNRCNASCIWCPVERGTKHNFDLSYDSIVKIIEEVADPSFPYKLDMIHISENGEALYHPEFLKIVRYIKKTLPDVPLNFLSNFGLLTPKISKALMQEKLLSSVQVNIDGHDEESYRAVKGISFKSVIKNVKHFLAMREKYDPEFDFCINVMPAFEYAATVKTLFNHRPDRITSDTAIPFSSFAAVEKMLREFVPDNVRVRHSKPGLWSERPKIHSGEMKYPGDISQLSCPMIDRVKHEAFIAPNGDWYACCLDDNNDLVLGNINEQTVLEITNSDERKEFIRKLENKEFANIGYPCSAIAACQVVTLPDNMLNDMVSNIPIGSKHTF